MHSYIYISPKGDYPCHPGDIVIEHPEWNYLSDPTPTGWIEIIQTTMPEGNLFETPIEEFPEEINGIWYQRWKMIPTPPPQPTLESLSNTIDTLILTQLGEQCLNN